jgi:diguanylate cyclase (GGDEF)-like protein
MISSYITKPMIKIVKAVEGIGKGDFDVNLDINTNDELELLGYEIKKMSYELKYMYKNMEEIVGERTKELQLAHREMEEMATKDSLTGLYNRHYFNQYIQSIADDVKNNHKNMMILIIDIDKFKYVNDNYGHNIGDMVLKVVAKFLKNSTIESDLAVRYGGDEFLVALCDSRKINAEKYIKRVEKNLNEWNDNNDILNHRLTLSIGYDEYNGSKHILEAINNADKMMYENKIAKRKKEQG